MSVSKEIVELTCRQNCPFGHECGRSYLELENPCVENAYVIIETLRDSLSENEILDPQRPARKFSNPNLTAIVNKDEVPFIINFKSGIRPLVSIRIGEIRSGFVDFHGYQEEVIERIEGKAPIAVVKPQF